MTAETDIVIVGAGAAGIAAGVRLARAGVRFTILEAQGRIGGRAWTDGETFPGVPFDRGCHWLHEAASNPYRAIADSLGFAYDSAFSFDTRTYVIDGVRVGEDGRAAITAASANAYERIYEAARQGLDCAAAEVIDANDRWHPFADLYIGLDTSATPESVSVRDMTQGVQIGDDFPVEVGFGALVAAHGRELDISLSTPAETIDWSGTGVAVTTPRGTLRARAAIVTASTSVLDAGGIRFTPDLPDDLRGAVASVPLGCCEKVALLLDAPLGDFGINDMAGVLNRNRDPRPVNFYLNPFGRPLALAHVGGSYATELAREGDADMIAFATDALAEVAGSAVRGRIRGATATGWSADPFVRGAYSAALPGSSDCRAVLSRPVGERIFLAGEAVSTDAYASCHGAHATGIAAAERALALLGAAEPA